MKAFVACAALVVLFAWVLGSVHAPAPKPHGRIIVEEVDTSDGMVAARAAAKKAYDKIVSPTVGN